MRTARALGLFLLLVAVSVPVFADSPLRLWGTYPASWGDLCLPKYHALSEYSPPSSRALASPQWMVEINARLAYRLTVDFREIPLPEAARTISHLLGVAIVLSRTALDSGRLVTLNAPSMRGALVLDWICRLSDADWVLMNEAVYVRMKSELPPAEKPPAIDEIIEAINKESEPITDFKPPDDPIYGD